MQGKQKTQSDPYEDEERFEEWGSDMLVYHESDGEWIMYDPEDDPVELEDWA